MDNDITPNDSEALGIYNPEVPEEVATADQEEQSVIGSAVPIMDDLIDWFNEAIKATDSISNLDLKSDKSLETQLMATQLVKELLLKKRSELLARFDTYLRRNEDDDE